MRHLVRLRTELDVQPITRELEAHPEEWDRNTERQERFARLRETKAILLRNMTRDAGLSRNLASAVAFPETLSIIRSLCPPGMLCYTMIASLRPSGRIYPHKDLGDYYVPLDRYHLVVTAPEGSLFSCGGETVTMREMP